MSWSQDPNTYNVVFLVGDAPPHMDYQDDVKYPETVAAAAAKGIVVNTIQCGNMRETVKPWQQIAVARPRPLLHCRSGRQRGRDRDAVRRQDRDALGRARLDAALLRQRRGEGRNGRKARGERASARVRFACGASAPRRVQRERGRRVESHRRTRSRGGRRERRASRSRPCPRPSCRSRSPRCRATSKRPRSRRLRRSAKICSIRSPSSRRIATRSSEKEIDAHGGAAGSLDQKIYDAVREQAAPVGLEYDGGPKF